MINQPFISICIPSYNRPQELIRLLGSIDSLFKDEIEIIICEDKSPKRNEIKEAVNKFIKQSDYNIIYIENEINLGYDANLKELVKKASGEWIIFMGDDDEFVHGALDKLIRFLREHKELGYVLRYYNVVHYDGGIEQFRYFEENKFFNPGFNAYVSLFRKSVFISGFTIKREYVLPFLIDNFDGTLLFQLYLAAEITLKYPSAYFDEPLTQQYEKELKPLFGSAETEKKLYTPGTVTIENSFNFMKGFLKIAGYLDEKYNFNSLRIIKKDISKYSYPILSIQRDRGLKEFLKYINRLNKLGFNITIYYYVYIIALILFGKRICDKMIRIVKKILGRTPKL